MAHRTKYDFDLIAIGSGSGGSVGATYAASRGKRVAIVEAERRLGGECPNWACVPTKSLLVAADHYRNALGADRFGIKLGSVGYDYHRVRAWKDFVVERTGTSHAQSIFKHHGIETIHGRAHFLDRHTISVAGHRFSSKKFLIAAGTYNFIPPIEGLVEAGYITFRQAIDLPAPPKSLVIIGGGPIGCEFAELFSTFGSKVYLIEVAPQLLGHEEPEIAKLAKAVFEHKGVQVTTGAVVHSVTRRGTKKEVYFSDSRKAHHVAVDEILIAAGKRPNVDMGLGNAGVSYDKHGLVINRYLQTSNPDIYAAGDIVGPYQFTHTAIYQSSLAAHNMFSRPTRRQRADYSCIPRCIFVSPEVASVGLTEAEVRSYGLRPKVGIAPVSLLGRANVTNKSTGLVKVVCNSKGVILGAAIMASRAGEMIHELALAVRLKATADDVSTMVHAYPTWSEAIKIACARVK